MSILEAKINSVEYVAGVQTTAGMTADLPDLNPQPASQDNGAVAQTGPAPDQPQQAEPAPASEPAEMEAPMEAPAPAAAPKFYRYDQHPAYKHYFLLLRLGVNKMTIIQKIQVNGEEFDISILDNEPESLTDTPIPESSDDDDLAEDSEEE
eukprot:TRINITY_DN16090_c0_g1_i8.p1 TRINITY_DN16090_c0_g1~~TRINITY_DN16090_c0_g1_i8.p1  ORF type:complete len:151 (-),score=41.60 TRINITY_DN16090_c0_g1_i8:222-674(-)